MIVDNALRVRLLAPFSVRGLRIWGYSIQASTSIVLICKHRHFVPQSLFLLLRNKKNFRSHLF